jgi:hypothetical protein
MKLYQSPDGVWTGTQADAKAHARDNATTWKEVEVPVDKAGLLAFLNRHHVGGSVSQVVSAPPQEQTAPAAAWPHWSGARNYAEFSVSISDAWDKLALPHKLHLASLALCEAQEKVK